MFTVASARGLVARWVLGSEVTQSPQLALGCLFLGGAGGPLMFPLRVRSGEVVPSSSSEVSPG